MTIRYCITEEDFVNYQLHVAKTSPTMRRAMQVQRYGLACLIILAGVILAFISEISTPVLAVTYGLATIGWVIYYPTFFLKHIKRYSLKLLKEEKNSWLSGEKTFTMNSDILSTCDGEREGTLKWAAVERVELTPKYVYIHIGGLNAIPIPASAFNTEAEFQAFYHAVVGYYQAAKN